MLAFDYWLLPPASGEVAALHNGVTLEEMRRSKFFRARLTRRELQILDSVRLISLGAAPGLGADAFSESGDYTIRVTNGYSYLIGEFAHLLASYQFDPTAMNEGLMLLLASEYEAFQPNQASQINRRWYWAPTFDWYQTLNGHAPVRDPDGESYVIKSMTRALILHELCHHFLGHTDPEMVGLMRNLSGPAWTDRSHANEVEADVCAARHISAGGSDPRLDLIFLQAVWMTNSTDPSGSHPAARARLAAVSEVTRASGVTDYLDPAIATELEQHFEETLNFVASPRRLGELVSSLPRGVWPQCPMNPARRCE